MLKLYNTLSKSKEEFKPLEPGVVKMYTCGPTVYNYAHIGNLSAYLFADFLKRYLEYSGYKIEDVMNLTDVDDKTIKGAQAQNKSLSDFTSFYTEVLFKDTDSLNIKRPKVLCKATDYVDEMIKLVQNLVDKKMAYAADDGSVYFKVKDFKTYGELAGIKLSDLKIGASGRVETDEYEKEEASDFVLWKAWTEKDGDVYWESPWGKGRPGWHIECSAMSMKHLGETIDIHTGAIDLIFPHHQNEIAQSEAATGKKFVNYWLHRGFLKIDNQKMSKSLGNIYTLDDILKKVSDPLAFRYLILTNHYRLTLNFTFESLQGAENALFKMRNFVKRLEAEKGEDSDLEEIEKLVEESRDNFKKYLDNDLDAPKAIANLFGLATKCNKLLDENKLGEKSAELILDYIRETDQVWGFIFAEAKDIDADTKAKIEKLIAERNKFRAEKDWEKADAVRAELSEMGVEIKDVEGETKWELRL